MLQVVFYGGIVSVEDSCVNLTTLESVAAFSAIIMQLWELCNLCIIDATRIPLLVLAMMVHRARYVRHSRVEVTVGQDGSCLWLSVVPPSRL